jgi:hypothetical protein
MQHAAGLRNVLHSGLESDWTTSCFGCFAPSEKILCYPLDRRMLGRRNGLLVKKPPHRQIFATYLSRPVSPEIDYFIQIPSRIYSKSKQRNEKLQNIIFNFSQNNKYTDAKLLLKISFCTIMSYSVFMFVVNAKYDISFILRVCSFNAN